MALGSKRRSGLAFSFFTAFAGFAAVLASSETARARASFDESIEGLRLAKDDHSLLTLDFESVEGLAGAQFAQWDDANSTFVFAQVDDRSLAVVTTSGKDDVVEGAHAIRLGGEKRNGLVVSDPSLMETLASGRFEVTFWARSDGAEIPVQVVYDNDPNAIRSNGFANVTGIRSGRETTDGWVEYVVGPLDGSVWGVPVRGIVILPQGDADPKRTFLIDALEVRKVDGEPLTPVACTQANVDDVCGAEGDCMYGQCIPSVFTWGMLPAPADRTAIAERWAHFSTRLIGDRAAIARGLSDLGPRARELATSATSSRRFFGGLAQLVSELRDNHTTFGQPHNPTRFYPQLGFGDTNTLGACFGVVEKDVLGGGLAYSVFKATEQPATQTPLLPGDVLTAIDGMDPKAWVDEIWPRFVTTLPNDPNSDWGTSANDLSRLIAMRASKVSFLRCASSTSCSGNDRQTFDIDVASAARAEVMGQAPAGTSWGSWCTPRFRNGVDPSFDGNGDDAVYTAVDDGNRARIQFDGFLTSARWKAAFTDVFQAVPAGVLVDARIGHGGYLDGVKHIFDLVRGTNDPLGVVMVGRGTYDLTDPTWLFSRLGECTSGFTAQNQWACLQGSASGFFATVAAPPAASSRIAWVNTMDVSANDFMPRLLKGRANFRIFAPHVTSGAFGAVVPVPSAWPGWSNGSIQIQDSRFAADLDGAPSARWESGHGVEPDVVVVQKLSDTLAGVDTLLQTANAWLASQ